MPSFVFTKLVDPGVLHRLLVTEGFLVSGITFDSGTNQTTVILEEGEEKDPTAIVGAYVYVPYVPPNYPQLYADASQVVQDALTQYNAAAELYGTAYNAWVSAGATVTSGNALTKLTAAGNAIVALASAIDAEKDAIAALVNVVTVLARNASVVEEE